MMLNSTTVEAHLKLIEPRVKEICIGINIENHYNYVHDNNPSRDLPYHNWYHTICMVLNCYEAATFYNLPMSSVRAVCVAALWHDYAHNGGKNEDSLNVLSAIRHYLKFHLSLSSAQTRDHDSDLNHVPDIIRVTEYPYVNETFSIEQRIIRDADLMQITFPTSHEMTIIRLGKEMSVKFSREVTNIEMMEGQIKFLKEIKMMTEWGKQRMKNAGLTQIINQLILSTTLLKSLKLPDDV